MSPSEPRLMVSSAGRIMIIPYLGRMPDGGPRQYGGDPHFGTPNDGRLIFVFRNRSYKVAQLVCEAFNGPRPFETAVCLHRDEDFKNNKPRNLKWGTQKENLNAPGFLAYCRTRTGSNSPTVKAMLKRATGATPR